MDAKKLNTTQQLQERSGRAVVRRTDSEIGWQDYPRIDPGLYFAYCRWAKHYRDRAFHRWTCLLRFDVLSSGLRPFACVPLWLNLGYGEKPHAGRRSRYFAEWIRANGAGPTRRDRLSGVRSPHGSCRDCRHDWRRSLLGGTQDHRVANRRAAGSLSQQVTQSRTASRRDTRLMTWGNEVAREIGLVKPGGLGGWLLKPPRHPFRKVGDGTRLRPEPGSRVEITPAHTQGAGAPQSVRPPKAITECTISERQRRIKVLVAVTVTTIQL